MYREVCCLLLISWIVGACSATRSANGADPASIKLLRKPPKGCQKIGELTLVRNSKKILIPDIRKAAAEKGADSVHIVKLKVGMTTGKATFHGILLKCPLAKEDIDTSADLPDIQDEMPLLDDGDDAPPDEGNQPAQKTINSDDGALP